MREKEFEARIGAFSKRMDDFEKMILDRLAMSNTRTFYCGNCGNPFILNEDQYRRRLEKGRVFTCSAGHENEFI